MFNLDFFYESSFEMSEAIQKCMKVTKHPTFRKNLGDHGVFTLFVSENVIKMSRNLQEEKRLKFLGHKLNVS